MGAGGDARADTAAYSDRVIAVDVQDAPRGESFFSKKYLVASTNSTLTLVNDCEPVLLFDRDHVQ